MVDVFRSCSMSGVCVWAPKSLALPYELCGYEIVENRLNHSKDLFTVRIVREGPTNHFRSKGLSCLD